MTATRDILNRAADLVEQGWCQHRLVNDGPNGTTERCIVGALYLWGCDGQFGIPENASEAQELVEKKLGLKKFTGKDLVDWNNDPSRTQAEVVALLRSVAAELG